MRIDFTADLWWKNAVFCCLDVETFMDGDGDGCGDFTGLTNQVDYLAGLGVTSSVTAPAPAAAAGTAKPQAMPTVTRPVRRLVRDDMRSTSGSLGALLAT